MKWGVVTFPGSLDDADALYALRNVMAQDAVALLLLLYGLAMACLGTLIGMALRTVTVVQVAGFLAIFPITFASSTFVPVSTMPWWLRAVAGHTPVTAVVDVMRHLTLGAAATGADLAAALAWMLGILVVTIPAATYFFRTGR